MKYYWPVVLSIYAAWLSFWGVIGSVNGYYQWSMSEKYLAASRSGDRINADIYSSVANDYTYWVRTSVNFAILWPIPALVGATVAWFVFRFLTRKFEVQK